ncbi:hypothetical protein PybrP1_011311 [[Pythium] brassicae (nom. inval.)]|nr:hypothetical protein PybrP1_011311 [[Pythium] brassicae (nom. inval.)]
MKQPPASPPPSRHPPPPAALASSAPPSLLPSPPLAVPLGYGSGPSPPLPCDSVDVPALPVYRQHMQRPPRRAFHHVYQPTIIAAATETPRSQCAGVVAFLKLLLFNAANGALGLVGFMLVSLGLVLSLVTLPLCCFGVVLARVLLRVVYALCWLDAKLHNLVAGADDKIQFSERAAGHAPRHLLAEHQSLLPTHIDWQLQPHHALQDDDQLPQFEKSLADVSPRAVLATIYFGSVKYLVGLCSLIALALVGFVLAIIVDGDDVRAALAEQTPDLRTQDPLTLDLFALGLAVFAVAMLFANARLSQAITRFFCCEGGL